MSKRSIFFASFSTSFSVAGAIEFNGATVIVSNALHSNSTTQTMKNTRGNVLGFIKPMVLCYGLFFVLITVHVTSKLFHKHIVKCEKKSEEKSKRSKDRCDHFKCHWICVPIPFTTAHFYQFSSLTHIQIPRQNENTKTQITKGKQWKNVGEYKQKKMVSNYPSFFWAV